MSPYTRTCRKCGDTKPLGRFRGPDHTCRDCRSAEGRRRRSQPAARRRARDARLRRLYGITLAEFETLARRQRWRCRVCGQHVPLVVDHDHESGDVRGLLCSSCNAGLGQFGEDPERLIAAAEYLRNYAGQANGSL